MNVKIKKDVLIFTNIGWVRCATLKYQMDEFNKKFKVIIKEDKYNLKTLLINKIIEYDNEYELFINYIIDGDNINNEYVTMHKFMLSNNTKELYLNYDIQVYSGIYKNNAHNSFTYKPFDIIYLKNGDYKFAKDLIVGDILDFGATLDVVKIPTEITENDGIYLTYLKK